jgi:hypothetical protein
MSHVPPLFSDDRLADVALDEARFGVASFLRDMWNWFYPYADVTLAEGIRTAVHKLHLYPSPGVERDTAYFHFQQRFWEMYVGCALLDQGVDLLPRSKWNKAWKGAGPDLLATVEGQRVWIECIAPGPGTGADGVPEIGDKPVDQVPVDQIKLRFLSALLEKRRQVARHTTARIVAPEDGFVVAINSGCIPLAFMTEDPPWIARALYGLGNLAVSYNRNTKDWSEPFLTVQPIITKCNNVPIDTNLFGNGQAREVGGVIYSSVSGWNRGRDLASTLVFVHNRTAAVPLPDRWLPYSVSYSVKVEGNVGTITRADPPPLE